MPPSRPPESALDARRRAATLTALTILLAGCASPLTVEPAPGAADPACARVMLAMPDTVGGLDRRPTTSQATDAWGDDYPIVARCGVAIPGPTTDPCVTIDTSGYSTDWIVREERETWIATTYGRDPAVEVTVPRILVDQAVGDLLADLTPAAALADTTARACVGLDDASG